MYKKRNVWTQKRNNKPTAPALLKENASFGTQWKLRFIQYENHQKHNAMLYYKLNGYEDFKQRFGLESRAIGAPVRKNKILLGHLKAPSCSVIA